MVRGASNKDREVVGTGGGDPRRPRRVRDVVVPRKDLWRRRGGPVAAGPLFDVVTVLMVSLLGTNRTVVFAILEEGEIIFFFEVVYDRPRKKKSNV